MQKEYHSKGKKLYMCFVDLKKAFDRLLRKVLEWAIRKKGISEVLCRSVMSLHEGAKTRVWVDSQLSEEFEVKVWMHQGCVLSPFLFCGSDRCHGNCQRVCYLSYRMQMT